MRYFRAAVTVGQDGEEMDMKMMATTVLLQQELRATMQVCIVCGICALLS